MNFTEIRERIFNGDVIEEDVVMQIIFKMMELVRRENNIVLLASPITVVGDIHGQLYDLISLFTKSGLVKQKGDKYDLKCNPKKQNYLFLGDYVDRGYQSLNTFLFLATLKLQYPQSFTFLRGNHESRQVSMTYGFYAEVVANYGHPKLWNMCNDLFDLLPICALVDSKFFCVHGGLSPDAPLVEYISEIERKDEVPTEGLMADLLWSDPLEDIEQWRRNTRGAGYLFGPKNYTNFTRFNNLKLIIRSHQLCMDGYQKFYKKVDDSESHIKKTDENVRLLTVWSAPNYAYHDNNKATYLNIDSKYEATNKVPWQLVEFDKSEIPSRIPDKFKRPQISFYWA